MKCFFALYGNSELYEGLAKTFVTSAILNTTLDLWCVYDGGQTLFKVWLLNNGVNVIDWKVSFFDSIRHSYDGKKTLSFCRGTYLCSDLPTVLKQNNIKDQYIFYLDIDTILLKDPELSMFTPKYLCAPSDWDVDGFERFSTGSMIMNIPNLQDKQIEFVRHLKSKNFNFEYAGMGPCDQGAWNTFYKGQVDRLPSVLDWKPWWGVNEDAVVIHFSGPKPNEAESLILNSINDSEMTDQNKIHRYVVEQNNLAYLHYIKIYKSIQNKSHGKSTI